MNQIEALVLYLRVKAREFLTDEEGDTNFISILVLLGIALALAGVFLTFQGQIIDWVNRNIGQFFDTDVKKSS